MRVKPHRIIVRHKAYLLFITTIKGVIWVVCEIKHNLGFMAELWKRAILHCDMDAFFASVEQLDFPELRGRPVIVGGDPGSRTVVCAASYEARIYGVKCPMPIRQAMQLCPHGDYRRPRFLRYLEVSEQLMEIFRDFSPRVEPISVDEAFIDITGSQRLLGSPEKIARKIKKRVLNEVGLTISVGASACKFIAKIASDAEKPDGLVIVNPGDEKDFLEPLTVDKMWGVGPVTLAVLNKQGIFTIGDLARANLSRVHSVLGKPGRQLYLVANAVDFRDVETGIQPRGIGNSTTLEKDTTDIDSLSAYLLYLSHMVGFRLRQHKLAAKTITCRIRWSDMNGITRQAKLPFPTDIDDDIFYTALDLLKQEPLIMPIRKIGVKVSGLEEAIDPMLLTEADRSHRLSTAMDIIDKKYGDSLLVHAAVKLHMKRSRSLHPLMLKEMPHGNGVEDEDE